MFYGCTSLTTAPKLPATTLYEHCYDRMFHDCTNLTAIPALPATTLTDYCYDRMFKGCKSLKLSSKRITGHLAQIKYTLAYRIPTTGNGTTATFSMINMFLETGGTFRATPDINTTYYLSQNNKIV